MKYIKLVIALQDAYQESLIAELSEMEFDGFQQLDEELIAYIPKERFHIGDRERIEQLLAGFPGEGYVRSEEVVADQNWNEEWEKTVQAQEIGLFLVKPTWSGVTPQPDQILLEIDPKMSFGTGYHETTRLMLKLLPQIISTGDHVLDAGTGTGILGIAAIKLGAGAAFAFDIDEWSVNNALENVYLNRVNKKILIEKGSIEVAQNQGLFDVILANIERNVISEMIPHFYKLLNATGQLLVSGILEKDQMFIKQRLAEYRFAHIKTVKENEWVAMLLKSEGRYE